MIARNVTITAGRRRIRDPEQPTASDDIHELVPAYDPGEVEKHLEFRQVFESMGDRCKEVLLDRLGHSRLPREIAKETNLNVQQVKDRIRSCVKKLLGMLRQSGWVGRYGDA